MQSTFRKIHYVKSVILCNFTEITLRHGCSPVNLLHIFRTSFPKNTSGQLLQQITKSRVFRSSKMVNFEKWIVICDS